MRNIDRRTKVTRRVVLRGASLAVPGAVSAAAIAPSAAWAQAAKNLTPATMATLAQAARDIYPHDRIADAHYITAISGYDSGKPEIRDLMNMGCASLDAEAKKRHGTTYILVNAEDDRVAILRSVEKSAFFTKLRSDLVVTLYNQKSLWMKFGYEGSSADKGGYINRGFNDIDWLG
jgi:hypothetical protein